MTASPKIGIYSGTFDPIHHGHIAFANEAIEQCGLDKVFLLVEPRPRHKQGVKAFEHRSNMVGFAVKSNPKLGSIILDQAQFTPRETLPLLAARFSGAELYMLIGDDVLDHLGGSDWPHVEELTNAVGFIIGVRQKSIVETRNQIKNIETTYGLNIRYELFKPSDFLLSSSQIKQSIKKRLNYAGLDLNVADYIRQNNLYSVEGE